MNLVELQEDTLAAALACRGWQPVRGAAHRFALRDAGARLSALARRGDWETYALRGKTLPPPTGDRWLYDNGNLAGPVKWIGGGRHAPLCRADVPRQWPAAGKGGVAFECSGGLSPRQAWAAAVTDLVRQAPATTTAPLPLPPLAEELQRAGWAATLDGQRLLVHLSLPGLYQEVCLERRGSGHLRVAATLAELAGYPAESRRAAVALAAEANARLPLVRYAIAAEAQGELLKAEVCLSPECALVPGGWLPTAVEVVEAAVSLSAREMQALRDPELAQLVLAATAANARKEV